MSYLDFPNDTHHDAIGEIPNENTMFETDIDEELDQLKYTFFPDPELTKLNGSYRIGVKLVRKFPVTFLHYTLRRNSSLHFISSSQPAFCRYSIALE